MTFLYKNWVFHNLVSHPLSEILYWLLGRGKFAEKVMGYVHDFSIPEHKPGEGRG